MSAIKTFLRSLAQAFGISSPQQVKPQPVATPSRPQTAKTTKKGE
jgi:hypothetical protein